MKSIRVILIFLFFVIISTNPRTLAEYPDFTFGQVVEYALTLLAGRFLSLNQKILSNMIHYYAKVSSFNSFTVSSDLSNRTISEMVKSAGYDFDEHLIRTKDDYYMGLWRIRKSDKPRKSTAVILHHGLLGSSFSWIFSEPSQSLAYLLANEGYDVWLVNNRGNTYSRKSYISLENYAYWLFSLEEMLNIDFNSNIEYIKKITNSRKFFYIGHSEGASQFLLKMMENPEYKENFKAFIGMGAILIPDLKKQDSNLQKIINSNILGKFYVLQTSDAHFVPEDRFPIWGALCDTKSNVCFNSVESFSGKTEKPHYNASQLSKLASRKAGGTSVGHLLHWSQIIKSGRLQKMDFGEEKNLKRYGSKLPAEYNLTNLGNLDIAKILYIGDKDVLADKDLLSKYLRKESTKIINVEDYGHMDYILGVDANEKIYKDIIKELNAL